MATEIDSSHLADLSRERVLRAVKENRKADKLWVDDLARDDQPILENLQKGAAE